MASSVDIVTLDEAKTFLNITVATFDAELAGFITAASQMWINRVGPVGSAVFTEWYDGGTSRIALRNTPVLSVTSVVESYGSTVHYTLTPQDLAAGPSSDAWGYTIDTTTGLLTRRAAGVAISFAPGQRNVQVVYTAGYAAIPEDIKHAVDLLIMHLWQTQRGGSKRPGQGGTDDWRPDFAFSWPSRVEEIAAGYRIPGIA